MSSLPRSERKREIESYTAPNQFRFVMKNLALSTRQRREQIGSIEFGTEEKLRASKISEMYVAIRLRRVGAVSDELVGAFLVRLRCVTQCERRAPGDTHSSNGSRS